MAGVSLVGLGGSAAVEKGATGSTISLPYPVSGIVAKDVAAFWVSQNSGTPVSSVAGWQVITFHSCTGDTAVPSISLFYRICTGSENNTSASIALPSTSVTIGRIGVWRGIDNTTPVDGAVSIKDEPSPTGGAHVIPGVTPTIDGCLLLAASAINSTTSNISSITGPIGAFTIWGDRVSGTRSAAAGYRILGVGTGGSSTGNVTATHSAALARGISVLVALRAAIGKGGSKCTATSSATGSGRKTTHGSSIASATSSVSGSGRKTTHGSSQAIATSSTRGAGRKVTHGSSAAAAASSVRGAGHKVARAGALCSATSGALGRGGPEDEGGSLCTSTSSVHSGGRKLTRAGAIAHATGTCRGAGRRTARGAALCSATGSATGAGHHTALGGSRCTATGSAPGAGRVIHRGGSVCTAVATATGSGRVRPPYRNVTAHVTEHGRSITVVEHTRDVAIQEHTRTITLVDHS